MDGLTSFLGISIALRVTLCIRDFTARNRNIIAAVAIRAFAERHDGLCEIDT